MECNPFHAGHQYIIETARDIAGEDGAVIVAMSGNFMQRGIPAVQAKEERARQILAAGADLILELPVRYATSGAEYFARGSVALLLRTGLVTDLVFGSECADLERLQQSAEFLCAEPEDFRRLLQENLSSGMSWPTARARAAAQCHEAVDLPDSPNDLLAAEYLRELRQLQDGPGAIHPHAIARIPACSASSLREELQRADQGLFADDFSGMLADKLLMIDRGMCRHVLTDYAGVAADLAHRIHRLLPRFVSWTQFCSLLKTRNLTSTAVHRALTHILLDITSDMLPSIYPSAQDMPAGSGTDSCVCLPAQGRPASPGGSAGSPEGNRLRLSSIMPYARVLGCRRSALPLLGPIRRQGLPLITSRADADRCLPPGSHDRELLNCDLYASETWEYAARLKGHARTAAAPAAVQTALQAGNPPACSTSKSSVPGLSMSESAALEPSTAGHSVSEPFATESCMPESAALEPSSSEPSAVKSSMSISSMSESAVSGPCASKSPASEAPVSEFSRPFLVFPGDQ